MRGSGTVLNRADVLFVNKDEVTVTTASALADIILVTICVSVMGTDSLKRGLSPLNGTEET